MLFLFVVVVSLKDVEKDSYKKDSTCSLHKNSDIMQVRIPVYSGSGCLCDPCCDENYCMRIQFFMFWTNRKKFSMS